MDVVFLVIRFVDSFHEPSEEIRRKVLLERYTLEEYMLLIFFCIKNILLEQERLKTSSRLVET